jgi:hypothetical protein
LIFAHLVLALQVYHRLNNETDAELSRGKVSFPITDAEAVCFPIYKLV